MLVTKKSNPSRPVRIMIYSVEGCGKSTFGARSDSPIFISPEGGTDQLTDVHGNPVEEIPNIKTWDDLLIAIESLKNEKHEFKTLVLDSADWIESLAHAKIIGNSNKTIITCNSGYGSGYRQSQNMHKALIDSLSELRDKRNMNIIITAHAHVKPVKDPDMLESYDAFEIKCHEFVASLWREWIDALFFARFRTYIKTSDDSNKIRALGDGSRVVYTEKKPAFQAKNRYGMPPEFDFTLDFWKEVHKYAKKQTKIDFTEYLMKITDAELKAKVEKSILDAGTNKVQLEKILLRLKEVTGGN